MLRLDSLSRSWGRLDWTGLVIPIDKALRVCRKEDKTCVNRIVGKKYNMVMLTFSATMSELGDKIILRHKNQNSTISNSQHYNMLEWSYFIQSKGTTKIIRLPKIWCASKCSLKRAIILLGSRR